jgi:hypothetical protein
VQVCRVTRARSRALAHRSRTSPEPTPCDAFPSSCPSRSKGGANATGPHLQPVLPMARRVWPERPCIRGAILPLSSPWRPPFPLPPRPVNRVPQLVVISPFARQALHPARIGARTAQRR